MSLPRKYAFLLSLLLLAGIALPAQSGHEGAGIVNFRAESWKTISTENFDIYYTTPKAGQALRAAQFAEESLYETSRLLDYRHKDRYAIWIYNHPYDLITSNQYGMDERKQSGVTPLLSNSGKIIFPGTMHGFRGRVKAEVAHLLLKEFYYGGGIQISIQNQTLLHTPDWFVQGFSDFVGEGWTFEDEMWVSSVAHQNLIDFALEGQGEINRVVRKSIWFYITRQYGIEKLSEIFYMTRLTRSVEGGVITVLGITLKTLTERWREFMLGRISANKENRIIMDAAAKRIPIGKKDRILSMSLNPVTMQFALLLERKGKFRLDLYDPSTRKFTHTSVEGGFPTRQLDEFNWATPMAWSPDGQLLLTMVFENGFEKVVTYDARTDKAVALPYRPMLDRVLGYSWMPNSKEVIVSGLKEGQIDLFRYKPGSNQFKQFTDDPYDKLDPVISPDGQYVYYSSNRDTNNFTADQYDYVLYRNDFDIYRLSLTEAEAVPEQVTNTREVNEKPLYFASSFELVLMTDESGIPNLAKRNVFLGEMSRITDFNQGLTQVSSTDSLIAFSTPDRGKMQIYWGTPAELLGEYNLNITDLRFLKHMAAEARRKRNAQKNLIQKEVKVIKEAPDQTNDPKPDNTEENETKSVKFYVFDEEEDTDTNRKRDRNRRTEHKKPVPKVPEKPDFNQVVTKNPSKAKTVWSAQYLSSTLSFDPPWFGRRYGTRLNFLMETGFADLQGNHRLQVGVRPYLFDLRSADFTLNYQFLKNRIDWFGSLNRRSRYINSSDFLLRYVHSSLSGGATYPINRFMTVGGHLNLNYVRRYDLNLVVPQGLDGSDFLPGAGASFVYKDVERHEDFAHKGNILEANLNTNWSTRNSYLNFATLRIDARNYTPFLKHMVLASRLSTGFSVGNARQEFMMGGVDNALFSSIQNGSELPLTDPTDLAAYAFLDFVTPLRGFLFNTRNGNQFVAANFELRLPVSRMLTRSLNSSPAYNFEIIPFFDFGTIWREGNPLSQKNPINNDPIVSWPLTINVQTLKSPFLMGFGSGVRATVFGYSLRADLAWGMEDYIVQSPKIHLSLGKNF